MPMTLGSQGEEKAAQHLEKQGYQILSRNYRTRRGEIDLVAREGEALVFIEVKSRRRPSLTRPSEAVNLRKKKKIARGALQYLQEREWEGDYRFDVVEIYFEKDGRVTIEHLIDAFSIRDVLDDVI